MSVGRGNCGHVEGKQAAAFDMDAVAGLPLAEDRIEPVDLAGGDTGVERFGDAVGELGNAERMRRHGAFPAGGDTPFGGRPTLPRVPIEEQFGRGEIGADRIEHALAEGAGKSLLGAEQHERRPGRSARAIGASGGDQREGPPDGDRDRRGIAVDGGELAARLLGARRGDAAHRVHHRAELADAVDARADVGEAFGHGWLGSPGAARSA